MVDYKIGFQETELGYVIFKEDVQEPDSGVLAEFIPMHSDLSKEEAVEFGKRVVELWNKGVN